MKNLIALMILVIGMVVVWPPGMPAQASTVDQVCVVENLQSITPAAVMLQEEGGAGFVQSYTLTNHYYCTTKVIMQVPNFTLFYNFDFRTCYYAVRLQVQNEDLLKRKKVAVHRIRIRTDTQVG